MLKKNMHVLVRKKNIKYKWEKKVKRNSVRERRWNSMHAQHAWPGVQDRLTNISTTSAGANQYPAPEWPNAVVMDRGPISPYILS